MSDLHDAPTYACDRCEIPCELAALVPFKGGYVCRICYEQYHPATGRSTNRREGNELAKGSTVFEDWPGA